MSTVHLKINFSLSFIMMISTILILVIVPFKRLKNESNPDIEYGLIYINSYVGTYQKDGAVMTEKLDFLFGQGSSDEKCKGTDLSRMGNIVC